jgi:uncharacterized lipoprotein YajG
MWFAFALIVIGLEARSLRAGCPRSTARLSFQAGVGYLPNKGDHAMPNIKLRISLLFLTVLVAAAAYGRGATPKELIVSLKFKPQEGTATNSASIPPSMHDKSVEIRVEDGRGEKEPVKIGQGTGGDDRTFPIRASSDVQPYLKGTLDVLAKDWSLTTASTGADRILVIKVTRFYIDESNKALGSTYAGEVKLSYTLKTGSGTTLTEGVGAGSANRYGRAHSEENINEVLSDALKEAFANILNDSGVQSAWASGKKN